MSNKAHFFNFFYLGSVWIIFAVCSNCIQKKEKPTSIYQSSLLNSLQQTNVGAPKSIGLDLYVDKRAWNRGCETRSGNLIADSYAWKGNADIGIVNGGNIRDDQNFSLVPKGTIPDASTFSKFVIFKNKIQLVKMNGYRIKQMLENAYRQMSAPRVLSSAEDQDGDGPQHGDCYTQGSGSGRFYHLNSNIQVDVNLKNTALTLVSGTSSSSNNLKASNNGARITRLSIKGVIIYSNTTGAYDSGWSNGLSSCTVRQTSYSNSAACNLYTVALPDFQVTGGDGVFSFNPSITGSGAQPSEFSGDSPISAEILNADLGVDTDITFAYMQTFTTGPVFPKISNRILFSN